jgi:8-oxo-dGTP pyrophosphatase MutT (NUDIX family)
MSYGIIAVKIKGFDKKEMNALLMSDTDKFQGISSLGKVEYLLINRKDSLAFVEFVRGKYAVDDMKYVTNMLGHMTIEERTRLGIEFDALWRSVWGEIPIRSHKQDYDTSKEKYNTIMENGFLASLTSTTPTTFTEPEWGFPKGRRNPGEDDLVCAMREFYEETGLGKQSYTLVKNMEPLEESFFGTNGVHYCHKYYLAICDPDQKVVMNMNNPHMFREIGDISWFTLDNAITRIRSENVEKREILLRAESILRNYMLLSLDYH